MLARLQIVCRVLLPCLIWYHQSKILAQQFFHQKSRPGGAAAYVLLEKKAFKFVVKLVRLETP